MSDKYNLGTVGGITTVELWSGEANKGETVELSDAITNYKMICVFTGLKSLTTGAYTHFADSMLPPDLALTSGEAIVINNVSLYFNNQWHGYCVRGNFSQGAKKFTYQDSYIGGWNATAVAPIVLRIVGIN